MGDFRLKQLHGKLGDLVYQFSKVQFAQGASPDKWAPCVNAYRCSKGFAICVDLAGVEKDKINLEIEPHRLKIQGVRATPEPHGKGEEPLQILSMEIDSGAFEREIALPGGVETESVRAEYNDGLLWIYLPYRSQA